MGIWDWIIIGLVAAAVVAAAVIIVRNKKKGKCSCGCDACPGCDACRKSKDK